MSDEKEETNEGGRLSRIGGKRESGRVGRRGIGRHGARGEEGPGERRGARGGESGLSKMEICRVVIHPRDLNSKD